jgi:hypothetical protein
MSDRKESSLPYRFELSRHLVCWYPPPHVLKGRHRCVCGLISLSEIYILYIYMHIYICICIFIYIFTYIYIYIHVCTYLYLYTLISYNLTWMNESYQQLYAIYEPWPGPREDIMICYIQPGRVAFHGR